MVGYNVLIVDDQVKTNELLYQRLFQNDDAFTMYMAKDWTDFTKQAKNVDAVVLDVNLEDWGKTLAEALEIIGGKCPVVLVSKYWAEQRTHQQIAEALAKAKRVPFVGTLVLNDLGCAGWESHVSSIRSQLRIAIARYSQQGLLKVEEDESIRILHLSDPQYGDPGGDNLAFLVEKEIPRFVLGELNLNIHFIVITGDITFSGQPKEFEEAEAKLKELIEAFLPNREDWQERLLLVPGNHDVNFRLAAADGVKYNFRDKKIVALIKKENGSQQHRPYALQPFRDFVWRLTGNPHSRDAEDLCWINDSFRHIGLRFYMLNSVSLIDCNQPNTSEIPTKVLEKQVGGLPLQDGLFGIALAHHGPRVNDKEADEEMVESLSNWFQVGKLIQNSPIRLLVHGHGHQRFADIYPLVEGNKARKSEGLLTKSEVLRVMAPTTHLQKNKRPIGERRGFNLITLNRSHGSVEEIVVDSYELGEDRPHKAKGAPWTCRI